MVKLTPPIIPAQLVPAGLDELIEGGLEAVELTDIDAINLSVVALDLDGVVIERGQFTGAQLMRVQAKDLRIRGSDFSAASLADGGLLRMECRTSRLTGTDFSKTSLHDVTFVGCKLDMANFRFSDVRRVKFIDCTLSETDFLGATLHDVVFGSCQLDKTVFDQAKCKLVDLRGSELAELSGWSALKGAIIDTTQLVGVAPYLARELGLTVRDR